MKNKQQITEEVEKTLQAFDTDPVLEGDGFVFRGIPDARKQGKGVSIAGMPALAIILLAVLIILNAATLFYTSKSAAREETKRQLVNDLQSEFQIEEFQESF